MAFSDQQFCVFITKNKWNKYNSKKGAYGALSYSYSCPAVKSEGKGFQQAFIDANPHTPENFH